MLYNIQMYTLIRICILCCAINNYMLAVSECAVILVGLIKIGYIHIFICKTNVLQIFVLNL